jgi:hypothetical protein
MIEMSADLFARLLTHSIIETLLNLLGLILTGVGAFITALAVIISDKQADELSGTYFDGNEALRTALLQQSRSASKGLWFVVVGTGLQAAALIYHLLGPP